MAARLTVGTEIAFRVGEQDLNATVLRATACRGVLGQRKALTIAAHLYPLGSDAKIDQQIRHRLRPRL